MREIFPPSAPPTPSSGNSTSEISTSHGIYFEKNHDFGIDSFRFAELMMLSGLVCDNVVSWVTFHNAYNFEYLVKLLMHRALPQELREFLRLVRVFLGDKVFDVKHLMRFCSNLHGGLDRVSQSLKVERALGKSHQAGWHGVERSGLPFNWS
ncbi:hypothetical protein JHK82_017393 [Glycine max]|nr:hypothetical protein JHK85_017833 [Glycine max]KAG5141698.1 hypothetical protein JHK82_017393 [Glycine max]